MGHVLTHLLWEEWVTEPLHLDEYINHKANLRKVHFYLLAVLSRSYPSSDL